MKSLLAKLLGITTALLNFYLPDFKELLASGVSALLPVALDIVRSLASADVTSTEKRNMAINRLKEAAVQKGIEASESLIRYTVESAVSKLKAENK